MRLLTGVAGRRRSVAVAQIGHLCADHTRYVADHIPSRRLCARWLGGPCSSSRHDGALADSAAWWRVLQVGTYSWIRPAATNARW